MQKKTASPINQAFMKEVVQGLTDYPKHLSSKYFYDEKGDALFQQIMAMPEYYLTDCEFEIFRTHKDEIVKEFAGNAEKLNLIELGAGDGKKTKILLEQLQKERVTFTYIPIDISANVLQLLSNDLARTMPGIEVAPKQGTYFESLEDLCTLEGTKKVILFLGSNIGNLLHPKAIEFLRNIRILMGEEDLLFIGCDQKKHPQTILDAYNDSSGITEAFNKNILHRINREFHGNFEPDSFLHWETYDPESGTARSYLVSKEEQRVTLAALGKSFTFKKWESIHTEISQKYDDDIIRWMADKSGLRISAQFSDERNYFKNYIFKRK